MTDLILDDTSQQEKLSPFDTAGVTPFNPEYAQTKAEKYALVLGKDNPGPDAIATSINSGDQGFWDNQLSIQEDVNNTMQRNSLIQEVAQSTTGRKPTVDEIEIVRGLSDAELFKPDVSTALERNYSKLYTNFLSSTSANAIAPVAFEEDENAAYEVLDRAQTAQTRALIANDLRETVEKEYSDSGYFTSGVAWAKTMIPGYTWYKQRNNVPGASAWLTGNNLDEQLTVLYNMPPRQFKETLKAVLDNLKTSNIVEARDFANAVVSYGTNDRNLGNIFNLADLASIPTSALTGAGRLAKGMAKTAATAIRPTGDVAVQAARLGLNKEAVAATLTENIAAKDLEGLKRMGIDPSILETRLPSSMAPGTAFIEGTQMSSAGINRVLQTIKRNDILARKFASNIDLVDRLEPQQIILAQQEAMDAVKDQFSHVNNHIIDTRYIPAESDKLTNTASVSFRLGNKDGSLFQSEASAKSFATRYIKLKTDDYTIEQNGLGGYYIDITRPVADVGKFREYTIPTELKAPDSGALSNKFIAALRSNDYKLAEAQVKARGRVVQGQELMARYTRELTEPFSGKSQQWIDELDNVMASGRTQKKYFNTLHEFETEFSKINGKLPDPEQAAAYFTYREIMDLDYVLRDLDIVKQKVRLGGENIIFKAAGEKEEVKEFNFDGKVVDALPRGSKDNFRVTVVENGKINKGRSSRFLVDKDYQRFDDLVKNKGYKIVLDPESSTYYVIKDFKRNRIKPGGLNYVEGGHNEYRYKHYIKQGDISEDMDGVAHYRGDKALYVAPTEKEANDIANIFEKARQLYNQKAPNARKFIEDNLPITYADWVKKIKLGDINPRVPFTATISGQRTSTKINYANVFQRFDDGVASEHNIFANIGGRYLGEQADTLLDVMRAENGVVIKTGLDPLLRPMESMRVSTADLIDLRLVQDYKLKAVEDWVQEFGHLIDGDINAIRANPVYYMNRGVYKRDADLGQRQLAENVRMAALTLYNQKDNITTQFNNYREKLLSTVYEKWGENGRRLLDDHLIHDIKDVPNYIRAMAFNMKLGLFNPKQLFLQASAVMNASLIAGPARAADAARVFIPMVMALKTDDLQIIKGLATKYKGLTGWSRDDFVEMIDSYRKSGYSVVGKDVSYLDNYKPTTFTRGGVVRKAWSYQTLFFEAGEKISRHMSYAMAYKEWKLANPGKQLDRFGRSAILQRARNLTQNMTRDAQAGWQQGWTSLATQFMGYQARFMEQLWDGGILGNGRKLSRAEKARLVVGTAALYGVPVAASGYLGVVPVRDVLRDWMAQEGVKPSPWAEPFMDGFLSSMWEALTGNDADFAAAYGPNGVPTFRDLLNEDATWYDILMGAGGGVTADLLGSIEPGIEVVTDIADPNSSSLTAADLLEPFKNISSVQAVSRVYEAVNTHRWLSRKGQYLTEVGQWEAITSAILGVNPERVSEAYSQIAAMKHNKEGIQNIQKEMQKWYSKAIDALKRGDQDSYIEYKKRADRLGIENGLTLSEWNTAGKRALNETPLDESVFENYNKMLLQKQMREGK